VACECRLPYRETAALLNRLGRRCEWHGRDPLDVLRRLAGEPTGPDDVDALLRALRGDGGDLGDLGDGRDDLDDGRDRGDRGDPGGDGVPGFPDDDPPWW
jgi:hypothetical protein